MKRATPPPRPMPHARPGVVPQLEPAPILSEFRERETEQAFLCTHLALTQSQLRVTFLFCALLYVIFAITDIAWLGDSDNGALLLAARVTGAAAALASLTLLRRYPDSIAVTRLVATAAELAVCAGFLLIVWFRPGEFHWHAISMSIIIIVLYIYIPNRLLYASLIAVTATALFIALAAWRSTLLPLDIGTIGLLLALANLFSYVAARRYQLRWRAEYRAHTVLKNLSVRDHLTGCYNRRYLHEQLLENEIARSQRYELAMTVMLCDIDHFKSINDRYGHHGGDAVLQAFATLLQTVTRDGIDSVIRYGGEEFLLLLPETQLDGAIMLAERLRCDFADANIDVGDGRTARATASFGLVAADFATAIDNPTQYRMIASADEMLYAAKHAGRNLVRAQPFV